MGEISQDLPEQERDERGRYRLPTDGKTAKGDILRAAGLSTSAASSGLFRRLAVADQRSAAVVGTSPSRVRRNSMARTASSIRV
jgi:hypothetical protein